MDGAHESGECLVMESQDNYKIKISIYYNGNLISIDYVIKLKIFVHYNDLIDA